MVEISYQMILSTLQTAGLLVGIYYYLMVLRNQEKNQQISLRNQELALESQELTRKAQEQATETRQAQLFMQLYMYYLKEIDWTLTWPIISTKLSGMDEHFERLENDDAYRKTINDFIGFYEGLGVIVKEGYLSIRLIALMWAGTTRTLWENIIEPLLNDGLREKSGFKRGWSETEYLCRELMKYMEEHPELAT